MTIALSINIVYATWWKLVGDPIPWNNNYGAFLGTFGNPNFAGAFLGFGSSYLLTLILENKLIFWKKFVSICAIILNTWAIILTDTTQGILVFLVTSSSILFFYLYSKYRNKIPSLTFLLLTVISGLFAIFGMLQKGPLSGLLYKRSVSLRGSYWEAAFTTGRENMLFGVGFDSFGDYYRRARSIKAATNLPGPEIVTNAAHNLFLDIFAYGGAVLLIIYVSIFSAGLIASVRIIKGLRSFEIVPIALISAYLGYLAQSIISISQIGIGIWGWVLNGGLIAYSRISRNPIENTMIRKKKIKLENPEQFTLFIGSVIGLLICLPPYLADSNFTRALQSRDLSKLEKSLKASYFNPLDAGRIANAVNILQNSNFPELSLEYNRKLVKFNPDYADGWKLLIYQSKASLDERLDAKENLIRLDPKNNFWKEFKI
jgi:hypothetical protein